jgi:ABC-type glutathione transport system ATPase component
MSDLLNVRDLYVRYRVDGGLLGSKRAHVDVVHGVSLDIKSRETLAIVGESGSGKTTLAMALCGLAPVHAGEVRFDGAVVDKGKDGRLQPDRKRIALMFQDPVGSLSPRMTVRNLLAEPFHIHEGFAADPDRAAHELLDLVGLGGDFANRYPHQLSGGQARRVGVARALALKPDLLIADEPTAGLDVSVQGEILNLLADLQQEMGLAASCSSPITSTSCATWPARWLSCTWAGSWNRGCRSSFSTGHVTRIRRRCWPPTRARIPTLYPSGWN